MSLDPYLEKGKDVKQYDAIARKYEYSKYEYRRMIFQGWPLKEPCVKCNKPFNESGDKLYCIEYGNDKPPEGHLMPWMWWDIIHEGCL